MENHGKLTEEFLNELETRAVFFDKDLLIIDNLKDLDLSGKIEVDAYILLLCTKGRSTIMLNDRNYNMAENDLFICRPSHVLETLMLSVDFECICVCMSKEYMQNILLLSNSSWNMRVYIENNPVVHINAEDSRLIIQYAQLMKTTMALRNRHHYKKIIMALMYALSFDFSNMFEHVVTNDAPVYSSAEKTFNDFFDLLTSTTPRRRSVAYYADKLNITSKYLSVICKKVSGRPALEIITEYAVKEIETRLQKHDKSIKGIAAELGFENISYFSKYFKHYKGISPKKYREEFRLKYIDDLPH